MYNDTFLKEVVIVGFADDIGIANEVKPLEGIEI